MKLLLSLLCVTSYYYTHAFTIPFVASRMHTALNSVGVFYGTCTGTTEKVATLLADEIGGNLCDISDADKNEILQHDSLMFGAPTFNHGDEDHISGTAMDDFLYGMLQEMDLSGKKVAIFGCGDGDGYCDSYCDSTGEMYDMISAKGCEMFGKTSTEGYLYETSKAERDGEFIGYD
eukprot:Nitzschia sp. Nitz4//scaffold328_size19456//99//626//NITZ4_008715-RA/size19456-processed-gene-0.13-mRNA-1//-1//CDS//3329547956//3333//frame0